jgi:tetratricopeptide (TPR) repeat protein
MVLLNATRDEASNASEQAAEDRHRMAVLLFALKDYAGAARLFLQASATWPEHPWADLNAGLCLIRLGRHDEAIEALQRAGARHPGNLNRLDGLAEAYGALGRWAECREHGERSLHLKDTAQPTPDGSGLRAPQRPKPPSRDIIAFSLYGTQSRYLEGALRNARVAPYVYPGWHVRFYCSATVPEEVRAELAREGAEVIMMPEPARPADALFWRFLVAEDRSVHRFLVRDCDAVVNVRERVAVGEWLDSGKLFHLMRDHPAHTDLILAGMWGGHARVLPPLNALLRGFAYNPATESRNADQLFLGRIVWPRIRSHCLIHDSVYRNFGARDFPRGFDLPAPRHVGDNDSAARAQGASDSGW